MVRSIHFIEAGFTEQIEKFVNPMTGRWKSIRFPSTVAVIEHSTKGVMLFDTGYSPRFNESTKYFPEKLYSMITPVKIEPEQTAFEKIKRLGLKQSDISHVVLSHFHADHIAGAADFTSAKFLYSPLELQYLKKLPRLLQLKNAFIAALLPSDLEGRAIYVNDFTVPLDDLGEGWFGKDLLGDESVFAVPLPGHSMAQIGLYIRDVQGKSYFLIADAAWDTESFQKNIMPSQLPIKLIFYNGKQYQNTLARIHKLYCDHKNFGKLDIVTCHCDLDLQKRFSHV